MKCDAISSPPSPRFFCLDGKGRVISSDFHDLSWHQDQLDGENITKIKGGWVCGLEVSYLNSHRGGEALYDIQRAMKKKREKKKKSQG